MNNPLTRFTLVLILVTSWSIAWTHVFFANEIPGDGFTAGIFLLVAVMLFFAVLRRERASQLLPPYIFHWSGIIGMALLASLFLLPLFWGGAPLEHFYIPIGDYKLSSTTFFDLAIFMIIGGTTVSSLVSLEETPV